MGKERERTRTSDRNLRQDKNQTCHAGKQGWQSYLAGIQAVIRLHSSSLDK